MQTGNRSVGPENSDTRPPTKAALASVREAIQRSFAEIRSNVYL